LLLGQEPPGRFVRQTLCVKIKYFFTRRAGCRDDWGVKKYSTPASLWFAGVGHQSDMVIFSWGPIPAL